MSHSLSFNTMLHMEEWLLLYTGGFSLVLILHHKRHWQCLGVHTVTAFKRVHDNI